MPLPETLVLAFDTSAAHCAAALLRGDAVLAQRHEPMDKGQAERLMPMLDEILAEAGATWRDIGRIGVGIGPGNFTGVRIAVSAARGLALGLGISAVGVSTLEALALGTAGVVVTSLDARRGARYVQVFDDAGGHDPALVIAGDRPVVPAHSTPSCIGDDAAALADDLGGRAMAPIWPLAVAMARIARDRDPAAFTRPSPLYLRAADAAPPREQPPVILQ